MKVPVVMPQVTVTMTEGTVVRWLVREGDAVLEGQPILEIETDKTTVEVPAPQSGVVLQLIALPGDDVAVQEPIAYFEVGESQGPAISQPPKPVSGDSVEELRLAPRVADVPARVSTARRPISPLAARLARENGIDVARLSATGTAGVIVAADVRRYLEASRHAEWQVGPDETAVPMSPVRRRIAERMLLSTTATATVTTVVDVDMGAVAAMRTTVHASYTIFVAAASAQALRRFPYLNSELRGEDIVLKHRIHVGVAVSLDEALVVPVLQDADKKSLLELGKELEDLSNRARSGRLGPESMAGGTFTVTNSGVYGSLLFTPIINYPQAATLGMGKVADTVVVRDGGLFVRPIMYLCLSYDHRIIDGAMAVKFLQEVKAILERPEGVLR